MYHYVRNNEEHWYDTHSRRKDEFQSQVNFFNKNFDILNPKDIEKMDIFLLLMMVIKIIYSAQNI